MNLKKTAAFLLVALLTVATAWAHPLDALYDKTEYRIAMRDSVHLYTAVYTPKKCKHAPILIFRSPYGSEPYGRNRMPDWEEGYMRGYVDRGYILVVQDVRGRYESEGEFVHIRPAAFAQTDELTDSYDTVDFLVKNIPGNNGRVGFAGSSYPGFYALMGALCGHPAVVACSPQAPVTDWFMGDDVHHNGVLMLSDAVRFLSRMNSPKEHVPTERMTSGAKPEIDPDEYSFYLKHKSLREISEMLAPNPFWEELSAHADYDDWWKMRDTRRACYNLRPALLIVGGTFDAEDCFGTWNLYRAVRRQSPATVCHLVVGPWAHGAWLRGGRTLGGYDFGEEASDAYYREHFELPFFDCYLRGVGTDTLPAAAVFTSGDNRWRRFDKWTPRESRRETWYLTQNGGLSSRMPTEKNSSDSYVSDPSNPVPYVAAPGKRRAKEYMVADSRFLEQRSDVLSYFSEPLEANYTLAGPIEVALDVAISTTDADFVVRLVDVFPDEDGKPGRRMTVCGDVMAGRFRNGFAHPEAFVPGERQRVAFRMPDIAHTFRAGHRLCVQVQSSWFPLVELSPQRFVNRWRCEDKDFTACRVTLYHQRNAASSIVVYRID